MLIEILRWLVIALGTFMVAGTLLNLSSHPHWFIRGWDFPRAHIAGIAAFSAASYAAFFFDGGTFEWIFLLAATSCAAWQMCRVLPFTPLASKQVKNAARSDADRTLRLLICNVLMQNDRHELLLNLVRDIDPDVILLVEVDDGWLRSLKAIEASHPHVVRQPQDNMYGMVLYSRLPLIKPQVLFRVQDDIPSIRTEIELPDGTLVCLYGLHPRPPEPIRDQDATPRDAELVLVGREIEKDDRPTVVAGDLNDVAWSGTTRLFLRLSGLLDPRVGRGFYNTFDASKPLFRFPLDHVFHSNCFKLVDLKRLRKVGSDHFPVFIALHYEPQAEAEQAEPEADAADQADADEKIERAAADEQSPHV